MQPIDVLINWSKTMNCWKVMREGIIYFFDDVIIRTASKTHVDYDPETNHYESYITTTCMNFKIDASTLILTW